ncbi:fatty acid desaturase family protein [Haloplanus aerogenes]|uniref:Uncharacterized protein n=1 Tax=Haloplanus aerogenes TaxID=660522 RepID=A0A3M0E0G4_9EURY|nr:hypothetical protein [Haloplanus aerogenes]AZH25529.1 hypothetical protein DU502_09095 [Haloplanus aerogenes]RMB25243.1 hypothetical protein ATH50_0327 [Haloplanus aerogenes]
MLSDSLDYNHTSHWVSAVIEADRPLPIDNPVLASIVRFGTLPNAFFLFVVTVGRARVPEDFTIAIFFAVVWLNIGPALIWYYDERVMPTFFREVTELVENDERITALSEKYDHFFSDQYWIPTGLWTLLLLALFFRSQSYLAAEGMFTVGGPYYFVFLISVVWLGVFTGIGFIGVLTTMLVIRELSSEPLNISPLHPDGLGGLGFVGYYAIRTTLTFSSGSLLLPLAFIFVRTSEFTVLIYLIVVSYMGFIAVSFAYPTYKINKQAQRMQEKQLDQLRREYERAKRRVRSGSRVEGDGNTTDLQEVTDQLRLQHIREEYQNYQNVRLYPFQVDIIVKLVSSVVLPLVFLAIDQYLI